MPFLGLRFFKWAQLIFVSLIYAPSFPETTKNEKSNNYKIICCISAMLKKKAQIILSWESF